MRTVCAWCFPCMRALRLCRRCVQGAAAALNPRVRGSSPWRRTRSDLVFLSFHYYCRGVAGCSYDCNQTAPGERSARPASPASGISLPAGRHVGRHLDSLRDAYLWSVQQLDCEWIGLSAGRPRLTSSSRLRAVRVDGREATVASASPSRPCPAPVDAVGTTGRWRACDVTAGAFAAVAWAWRDMTATQKLVGRPR